MQWFEYRHLVGLEETNALGNVYFSHYVRWQGRCRELFLRTHAPDVLDALDHDHALVTTRCSCDYLVELEAFDEVALRMRLGQVLQNRLSLHFDYWRVGKGRDELVARGGQQVAWLRREGTAFVPAAVPPSLLAAIDTYLATAAGS